MAELFHPKKRMKLEAGSLSPRSVDSEKGKKFDRRKKRTESQCQRNDSVDNEGEKSPVGQDVSESVEVSFQGSEAEITEEKKKIDGDIGKKLKKKRGRRPLGGRQ